ncbi:MAG: class I tRNA ligase family protein, partial [Patescibacteria group bacterium]
DVINVIGQDAKMTKEAGKDFEGLTTIEAREKIVKLLEQQGLLDKIEDYEHSVGYCDRCGTTIEPIISEQWFVRMEELIKPAIKAVESGKIKVVPERYHDILINWMENIEDWCISRQLWWGHRLPVWFCENQTERISNDQLLISKQIPNSKFQILNSNDYIVSTVKPEKCPFCGHCQMRQSDDVLDTWFSSALWPFATLGWPEKTKDLKEFYPTSFLTTAKDIIFLWVARMIFSSLEFMKEIPFETVYIHATILNVEGRRMSKSLGTGIDPLELINKYGSDATRFGLMYMTNRDQQAIKFDEQTILACRNFINKLWNIARFIEMNIDNNANLPKTKIKPITLADEWILSRLNEIIVEVTKNIDNCEFGEAGHKIYDFVWHEFADWYLEIGKTQVAEDATPETKANTLTILKYLLKNILRLIHPFAPFVTETIYQNLKDKINLEKSENLLMINKWPEIENKFINKKSVADFEKLKNIIVGIRNYRTTNKIENNKILNISTEDKNILEYAKIINKLAKVNITPEAAGQTREEIEIENIKFKIKE